MEEDGCFSKAKLKTYPPRLNAVIASSFIGHLFRASAGGESLDFLDSSYSCLMNHCINIEANAVTDFAEQLDPPYALPGRPFAELAEWPDRDAAQGRDFAFRTRVAWGLSH